MSGGGGGGGGGSVRFKQPFKEVENTFQAVINAARDATNTAGVNFGKDLQEVAYVLGTGDLNNVGNSIINSTANLATAGQINPNLETGSERKRNQETRASEQAQQDASLINSAAQEADRQRRVLNILEGSARMRQRAPGSSATSIIPMGSQGANTLLTIIGGR